MTTRELELEAEIVRLREALENHSGNYKLTAVLSPEPQFVLAGGKLGACSVDSVA